MSTRTSANRLRPQSKTPDRRESWEESASALDTKAMGEVVDAVLAGKKAE